MYKSQGIYNDGEKRKDEGGEGRRERKEGRSGEELQDGLDLLNE